MKMTFWRRNMFEVAVGNKLIVHVVGYQWLPSYYVICIEYVWEADRRKERLELRKKN